MNNRLSGWQFAFMLYLVPFGSALVFLTGSVASQNAWISTLIGACFGLYVLYAIFKIHDLYPGQRITQISTEVLGKIPGTILNWFWFLGIFVILITFLFDMIMLMEIIYPFLPRVILCPLLILPCCYCLYKGINVLGRLGEITIVIVILVSTLGFILAVPIVDLSKLEPLRHSWRSIIAGAVYAADWPFDEIIIFALFLPFVANLQKIKSRAFFGFLMCASVLTQTDIIIIAVQGAELADLSLFPLYSASRLIGFENFQRVELLFFFVWLFTGVYTILVYYQGVNFIVQDLFFLKDYRPLILPLGLCIIVFTLYMFPNTVEYTLLGFKYLEVYTFPMNLLYPTIILVAAQYRYKRRKVSGASAIDARR
ncbi:MAG TPA: endospore germination permease [Syntrophomonas sp.]|nr:endospore germination permease [Syntrophomonas sp.]